MRIAVGIEYDGSQYRGWQLQQKGVESIQEKVEAALSFVANHPVRVQCAGRTDAGVHATSQVAHFDTDAVRTDQAWVLGAATRLPSDITLRWAKSVPDEFSARFSAFRRRYRYVIFNHKIRPGLFINQLTWNFRPLDVDLMREASRCLLGEQDFSSFRAVQCQAKSPVRTVYRLDLFRHGNLIVMDIEANAFLHHMVRNIVGVLMSIGSGHRPVEWVKHVLDVKDRTQGGVTAPPYGLYFVGVSYPEQFAIPSDYTPINFLPD